LWAPIAAIAIWAGVTAVLYSVAGQPGASWSWLSTLALAYLVPVALAALYWNRRGTYALALIGALAILPLAWQAWQRESPPGSLIGLAAAALLLPVSAYLLQRPLASGRQREMQAAHLATTADASRQSRAGNLLLINQVGRAIASGLQSQHVLDTIAAASVKLLDADFGLLLVWDEEREQLAPRAAHGFDLHDQAWFNDAQMSELTGAIVEEGRPIIVPDVGTDGRFEGMPMQRIGLTSMLIVPLVEERLPASAAEDTSLRRGPAFDETDDDLGQPRLIGALAIGALWARAFDQVDPLLFSMLAGQASAALTNLQLYQQTAQHVTALYSLHEVSQAITSTLDIDEMLDVIAEQTIYLTGAARSQILLVDENAGQVAYSVQRGYDDCPPYTCSYERVSEGLSGWVLREKISAISADVHHDERMRGVDVDRVAGTDARSMIVAPLLIDEEPVGIIQAVRLQHASPFAVRDLTLLNMLASQASLAIQNARFFEERKRQIIELSILNQTGQALSSTLQFDDLLELIYHQVARVMDAQDFYVALYDPDQGDLSFSIAYAGGVRQPGPGLERAWPEWLPRQGRQGLAGYVIETKRALWLPNRVPERLAEIGLDASDAGSARCWLGVPILADDRALGVMAVQSRDREDVYDQEHLELLMTIASQASIAIRNAQLFAQVSRMTENLEHMVTERTEALAQANQELTIERDRLNAFYEISRELSRSLELESLLGGALIWINHILGAEQGYILIWDSGNQTLECKAVVGHTSSTAEGQEFPSPRVGDKRAYRDGEGLVGWLMAHREIVRINDLSISAQWHIVEDQARWHRSALMGPLLSGEEIKGAILLYHSSPDHFTTEHQRMLEAIASQVATTVSSVEMFDLLTEAADRLGTMLRAQQLEAAKSQAILEGVADGVMVTDANGEITLFNAAAERILEMSRFDVIGRSEGDLPGLFSLAGTSGAQLREKWGGADILAGQGALYEEQLAVGERVINVRIAPVIRRGMFEGTVSVFRDITKDVEVDRIKGEFISMVSHELRTPMTSIKGYVDLLYSEMAGPISDMQRRFLQTVKNNADRLTVLVNSLVEINCLETGELNLVLEDMDPGAVVTKVVNDYMPHAAEKEHTLEALIPEPLPLVRADPSRVIEVLANLVRNAIHYTPNGGHVTVGVQVADGFVHMYVQDNGIGISDEDQAKLFGRFFRGDDPLVQECSGTGLGLFIVKSIVELHGGEMWFESSLGAGSTFYFSLPLAAPDSERVSDYEFRTISYRAQDKHILVVEDEVDIANLIAHQLRSRGGYRVHIVRYGRDALDYLVSGQHHVDLVTLDLRLPDMNGLEVLQAVKKHQALASIPVVIISVLSSEKERQTLGARAYLTKPIEADRLLATIEGILAEKARVLVVEDDPALVELFQMALSENGFTVSVVGDGRQVIDIARSERPGLIVLDVKLPGLDGFAVLAQLKSISETSHIPVIVITGSLTDAESKRQRVLEMGAAQFLTKPLDVEDLVAEIQQRLANQVNVQRAAASDRAKRVAVETVSADVVRGDKDTDARSSSVQETT
jgi:signal transduction histidine kinase/DNA-binding response OmpR family regulator